MSQLNQYYSNSRYEMAEFLPKTYNKVLEIGCGEGNFKKNLRNTCEYWGIEKNEDISKIAKNKLHKVIVGDFIKENQLLPNHYFDLIICNDIIEHIDDFNLLFNIIKKKMNSQSYIIGSIPNVRFYSNLLRLIIFKDWEYKNDGILDKTHLRFFTKKSFTKILKNNDFIIDRISGINGIKFSFYSLKNILKNLSIFLLGSDSRYLQFGFRIKNK